MVDWQIIGGQVADGLGGPLFAANVVLEDGRITVLGAGERVNATRTIGATGRVITPGFIDIHSHNDLVPMGAVYFADKVSQGVTTEVVGNCGFSPWPITERNRGLVREQLEIIAPGAWHADWTTWEGYASALERAGSQTNLIGQVGHGTLRSAVMGMDLRAPTIPELDTMQRLLAQCLREGAAGLSFGLMYHPSGFADRDEIRALCEVAADYAAFVSVHLRAYGSEGLLPGMEEMIWAAEQAGVRLQLSHLSPTGLKADSLLDAMFASVEAASSRGLVIGFDRYPYEHAFTQLAQLFPKWALAGGRDATVERLADEPAIERAITDIDRFVCEIGYDGIELRGEAAKEFQGLSLATIAHREGVSPARCAIKILCELGTAVPITLRLSNMELQKRVLAHPLCMVGSDGVARPGGTHPRTLGTFPRVLGPLVREGVLSLPQAIHKMTGQPANWLGITDRGRVVDGAIADLVIIAPATIGDKATFADPYARSVGIDSVFVAGQPVLLDGIVTDTRPGGVISKTQVASSRSSRATGSP
jgi:N-acyl-D-amino-acid deacylase